MVGLEGGNCHLPQHPTKPQIESARLTAIGLRWIRELIRHDVHDIGAAGRTAPRHMNPQPFLRGYIPRISRRTFSIVHSNRWIASTIRLGLEHKQFQLVLQTSDLIAVVGLSARRRTEK